MYSWLADFKSKNLVGKSLKSLKYLGKGLGSIVTKATVGSNVVSEKPAKNSDAWKILQIWLTVKVKV